MTVSPDPPAPPPTSSVDQVCIVVHGSTSESDVGAASSQEDNAAAGSPQPVLIAPPERISQGDFECQMCFAPFNQKQCSALSCGHVFHSECIARIFEAYRPDEGNLECPICHEILMRIIVTNTLLNLTPADVGQHAGGRTMRFLDLLFS